MLNQDNALVTQEEGKTKLMYRAKVDRRLYILTVVNYNEEGKSVVFRRVKKLPGKTYDAFRSETLDEDEKLKLGLSFLQQGWDVTQVATMLSMPMESFRE